MTLIILDLDHPLVIKVAHLQPSRMQFYFIDNEDYFLRPPVKELETVLSPDDNDERIIFFARGVVETVKKLRWEPAIIHCSGWFTALAPIYIKHLYNDDPSFRNSRVIFSLQSSDFDGTLDTRFVEKLKMDGLTDEHLLELTGTDSVNVKTLNRLAIAHSDGVIADVADADPDLLDFARSLGKPVLDFVEDADSLGQSYANFYNDLI